jgi:putative phosphoesterase
LDELSFGKNVMRIGVITDSHVPDRVGALHPDVLASFRELAVQHIIHAGDISSPQVLDQLEQVAPCTSVKGNRDYFKKQKEEVVKYLSFNNVKICINHGQGNLLQYAADKIPYILMGYRFERYYPILKKDMADANIIVFGHTHQIENRWINNKLFFNSGSAYDRGNDGAGPTIGLIQIGSDQSIEAKIIPLRKAKWTKTGWIFEDIR